MYVGRQYEIILFFSSGCDQVFPPIPNYHPPILPTNLKKFIIVIQSDRHKAEIILAKNDCFDFWAYRGPNISDRL